MDKPVIALFLAGSPLLAGSLHVMDDTSGGRRGVPLPKPAIAIRTLSSAVEHHVDIVVRLPKKTRKYNGLKNDPGSTNLET
jgi:hypothetical protein